MARPGLAATLKDFEDFRDDFTPEQVLSWLSTRLNRTPEANDVYTVAKELYHLGSYKRAIVCLETYISMPGALVIGRHLLAYAYLVAEQHRKALKEFTTCVHDGFEDDWQMVVELLCEQETTLEPVAVTLQHVQEMPVAWLRGSEKGKVASEELWATSDDITSHVE